MSLLAGDRAGYTAWTWTGGKCSGRDCTWSDGTDWDFEKFDEGILHANVSQHVFLADINNVLHFFSHLSKGILLQGESFYCKQMQGSCDLQKWCSSNYGSYP